MNTRYVDTQIWMNEIEDMLREGNEVPLNVTGESMAPFLRHGRDKVMLVKFSGSAQKGDILLYKRNNGQYVLHRVVRVKDRDLWLAGDAQHIVEGPVSDEFVIATVSRAKRNGKWISKGSAEWAFYEKVWIKTVGFRDKILKMHLKIKGK